MNPTRVITVRGRDRKALLADPDFIYVGRRCAGWPQSIWGNPFRVRKQPFRVVDSSCCATAVEAVSRYDEWVRDMIERYPERFPLRELRGRILGCWCGNWEPGKPDIGCHAVVLARLADGGTNG